MKLEIYFVYLCIKNREMKTLIHVGDKPLLLVSEDFQEKKNVDHICLIDNINLYGELVTMPALLNKIGLYKAEVEAMYSKSKVRLEIYEAQLRKDIRVEANTNNGKFKLGDEWIKLTERAIDEVVSLDLKYRKLKEEMIDDKRMLDVLDSWFWAATDKSKKLSSFLKPVAPEELLSELVEGKVNTFFIKKIDDGRDKG